jgi:protein SMG6
MEIEPEREQWRSVANEWFVRSVAATPSAGKLHQPLQLLS